MKSVERRIVCIVILCSSLWKAEGRHIRQRQRLLTPDEEAMARRFWRCCHHQHRSLTCSENSCYFFLEGDMTWREARRQCQDTYGRSDLSLFNILDQNTVTKMIAANAPDHPEKKRYEDWRAWVGFMNPGMIAGNSTDFFTVGEPVFYNGSSGSPQQPASGAGPFFGWVHFLQKGLEYGLAGRKGRAPAACNFTIPVDLYRRCFSDGYGFACHSGGKDTCSSTTWNGRSLGSSPVGVVQRVVCPGSRFEEYYECYPDNTWRRLNGSCYEEWAADILDDLYDDSGDVLSLASDMYDYVAATRETYRKRETPGQGPKDVPFSLGKVIDIVHSIVDLGDKQAANHTPVESFNFTQHVISTLSLMVDSDQNWEWQNVTKDEQSYLASKIIVEAEKTGRLLACSQVDDSMNNATRTLIRRENIELQVFPLTKAETVVCFPSCDSDESSSIRINGELPMEDLPEVCNKPAYVGVALLYRNLGNRLLRSRYSEQELLEDRKEHDLSHAVVNSEVAGFSLGAFNTSIPFEDKVVVVTLKHINATTKSPTCAFWNFSKLGGMGQWDTSGCEVDAATSTPLQTTCRCDHLTNFAVLVDMTGEVEDTPVMTVLTVVCCVLSIVCLTITMACLICVRALRCRRSVIACNVSFCLIVSNFIILTGFKMTQTFGIECLVTRSVLLYALLAAFMWMLLEGYHLYRMLVIVFNHNSISLRWFYAFGYGIPVAITAAAACLTRNRFRDNFCWFASEDIFYFCGPMIAVIVVNIVVLTVALSTASSVKVKKKLRRSESIATWLKGSASLVFLLGITWVLGLPLLAGRAVPYMEYVFTVVNGSQGVTMFLFHIACNEKARVTILKALRNHAFCGTLVQMKKGAQKRGFKGSLSFGSQSSTNSTQLNSVLSETADVPLREVAADTTCTRYSERFGKKKGGLAPTDRH
ncbi:adhesion G protein-coupled receptor L1-like [Ornithodoros turicata]|uniref:adhesion G protein-coupled receptor L1-like n=1 Tax=Ornithodoros turicata TaxID=34597 RepID=UPI00313943A3